MDDLTQAVLDRQGLFEAEEFDPLSDDFAPREAGGQEADQEQGDQIVDMPIVPEMPQDMRRTGVFDAERFPSAREATRSLLEHNPGRRPVLLAILDGCRTPQDAQGLAEMADAAQQENRSVYGALTLARMLERSGALTRREPDWAPTVVQVDGVAYLEPMASDDPSVQEGADQKDAGAPAEGAPAAAATKDDGVAADSAPAAGTPAREAPREELETWQSTPEGLEVLEDYLSGGPLLELLSMPSEEPLVSVYQNILLACADQPVTKAQLDQLVDDDPLVQEPRRYSNHFIELLESRGALSWHDGGWNTTQLGLSYLDQSARE